MLDPAVLGRYDGLALHVERGMGDRPGDRRFPGHPQPAGVELEAYTAYTPGDDLRHLDWNAVGRLDTLLVRRFTAEREVSFHVLIDCSASMDVPPADHKLATALELALALAYVALSAGDAARMALLASADRLRISPTYRQRVNALRVAEFLGSAQAGGALPLAAVLERYAQQHPRPGVALIVSDFMVDLGEVERGVRSLQARGYAVVLLQVIGQSELEPGRSFTRAVLEDAESGATHPMVLTPKTLARYRALLGAHLDALTALAERLTAPYARLTSDSAVAAFVTGELPRLGLVRRR